MGGPYEPRRKDVPAWQPEPLHLPVERQDVVTPESREEDRDTAEDKRGSHVVVIDLA